ncbi:MAG: P-type conjugative transfer protein TrbL [Pseudomonadota bacterium]
MKRPAISMKPMPWLLLLWLATFSIQAFAVVDNVGVLNNVLDRFEAAAISWRTIIVARATWLFWLLALISMVWTFGFMALRKADIGEFFAEFIRFTLFTGFFWWLLLNGPQIAVDIMKSLRMIGAQASGLPNDLGPSGIVDVGFDIFFKVIDQSTVWKPMDSLFGMLLATAILIVFALVGTNMLLLLVSGYLFAYAGVFILGFGGSKWTSDLAIGYYKSILNIALQLMTMVLLIGIGRSFVDQYYTSMSAGITLKELGVMAVVAAVLLFLVAKVPAQIGALAGGTTGELGSNFGVGAAVGAAAMGAAAVASAGAALAAGAASTGGGVQALMAAFSKANASESGTGRSGMGAMMDAAGGAGSGSGGDTGSGGGSGGGSALASAMGDSGSGMQGTSSSGSSSASAGSSDSFGSTGGGGKNSSSPGEVKPGRTMASAGALAAKVGKVAAGTALNLAQGSWDVARAKVSDMKESAMDHIAETTGGKIAAAIEARHSAANAGGEAAQFDEGSLAASRHSADPESEIAAFRDRK